MKQFRFLIAAILVSILAFTVSCVGTFEEDLADGTHTIEINSPKDSLLTNSFDVTFWWEEMFDAKQFHLQVVHPNFNAIEYFVLDTIISVESFTHTFEEKGEYSWRLRAENNSSETPYFTQMFTIDNTTDLVEHELLIVSPATNFASNETSLLFKWVDIPVAQEYLFSVQKDNADGDYVVDPVLLYTNSYTLDNTNAEFDEGEYYWSVQARNDIPSETSEKTRTFIIDRTAPSAPVCKYPPHDTTMVDKTIQFTWDRYDDGTGSAAFDSLYLLKENANNVYEVFRKVKNATTQTETAISSLSTGNYKWYVKTFDKAENQSNASGKFSFVIE